MIRNIQKYTKMFIKKMDYYFENDLKKIIVGGCLFFTSIFLKKYYVIHAILIFLSYFILSYEIYVKAYYHIRKKVIFDENLLMILASLGAFLLKEFPEGVMIIFLYQIGEYLGDLATDKSKESLVKLMDLSCDVAHVETNGTINDVDLRLIPSGRIIVVKPGEKIPLDGRVIEGDSFIDTSKLTGESTPRRVKVNDFVLSGSVNQNKILKIKVSGTLTDSTAYKIMKLMKEAENKKAKTETFMSKFARIYTPLVTICAFLIMLVPFFIGGSKSLWFRRALSFLVVSCPCALVISIPLCFFLAIGRGAREGILFKGNNELDLFRKIDLFVFDKTGTITKGIFKVTQINPVNMSKDELLEIAAYAEFYSSHPIAGAVIKAYPKKIDKTKISNYEEIPGMGISCEYLRKKIKVGNQKLVSTRNHQDNIGTVIYISIDDVYAGSITISDELKESAINTLYLLQNNEKKETIMVSGDYESIVKRMSLKLKMSDYYAEVLPTEKVKIVEDLKKKGIVAFVGDGMNDAPAIKVADVGIAMGDMGTDSAIEASDVIIMRDDLSKILMGITLSRKTNRILWTNIIFSIFIKMLFLVLGFFGITSLWMALFADVGVTVIVILYSIRILKLKL